MGIDYGGRRIGIAFTDLLGITANAYLTYTRVNDDKDIEFFAQLIKDKEVGAIVVGLPLNMDGEEQSIAMEVREWAEKIKNVFHLPIFFIDERLTSLIAEDILKEQGYDWRQRKSKIDALSAEIILQEYIDTKGGI